MYQVKEMGPQFMQSIDDCGNINNKLRCKQLKVSLEKIDQSRMAKDIFLETWERWKLCLWEIHLVGLGFYNEKDYHVEEETCIP